MDDDRTAFEAFVSSLGKYSVERVDENAELYAGLYLRPEVDEWFEVWKAAICHERSKHGKGRVVRGRGASEKDSSGS